MDPNDLPKKSCSEVTFQFQDICNIKTYDHALEIKTEPIKLNLKMTRFPHSVSIKSEPELQVNYVIKDESTILQNSLISEEI